METIFSSIILLFSSIKSLHFFFKYFINIRYINSFVTKFSSKGRKLISKNSYFTFKVLSVRIRFRQRLSKFSKDSFLRSNTSFKFSVVVLLTLKFTFVVFQVTLLFVKVVFSSSVVFTCFIDKFISLS
jgi:hypothetical protein